MIRKLSDDAMKKMRDMLGWFSAPDYNPQLYDDSYCNDGRAAYGGWGWSKEGDDKAIYEIVAIVLEGLGIPNE